jgi:hypothetical protein
MLRLMVVAEASADFPALEFKSPSAGESVEPGRSGAAGAAKQARARALLPCTLFVTCKDSCSDLGHRLFFTLLAS